jgi:hypothetical protein
MIQNLLLKKIPVLAAIIPLLYKTDEGRQKYTMKQSRSNAPFYNYLHLLLALLWL